MANLNAPYEIVYDQYRTLSMSAEYYTIKVDACRFKIKCIDIFLALFASGSVVLSFSAWKYSLLDYQAGLFFLGLFTSLAAVVGIAKPYLKFEDELERLSGLQFSYGVLVPLMKRIVENIKSNCAISHRDTESNAMISDILIAIKAKENGPRDEKLIDKLQELIIQRHPIESFYYPQTHPALQVQSTPPSSTATVQGRP